MWWCIPASTQEEDCKIEDFLGYSVKKILKKNQKIKKSKEENLRKLQYLELQSSIQEKQG